MREELIDECSVHQQLYFCTERRQQMKTSLRYLKTIGDSVLRSVYSGQNPDSTKFLTRATFGSASCSLDKSISLKSDDAGGIS